MNEIIWKQFYEHKGFEISNDGQLRNAETKEIVKKYYPSKNNSLLYWFIMDHVPDMVEKQRFNYNANKAMAEHFPDYFVNHSELISAEEYGLIVRHAQRCIIRDVRKAYKQGDTITLREMDEHSRIPNIKITGNESTHNITHVLLGDGNALNKGLCIVSIK